MRSAAPDRQPLKAIAAPDPALVARFARELARLRPLGPDDRLAVAVSGGPDSLALLLLAHAALPGRVQAATVDHGLRPESATEAAMVATVCAALAVPHATLRGPWDSAAREGVQAAARAHRYRLLRQWVASHGLAALATAHHADDQAETVLMRLARGSGVAGLAAIRASLADRRIVRPLLGFVKADLVGLVAACGLVAANDPSNDDPRYDRTHARRLLADTAWLDPRRLAAAAGHLADADRALDWATDAEHRRRASPFAEGWLLDPAGLPAEILRRLVTRLLDAVDPAAPPPRGGDLDRLIARLERGNSATLGRVLVRPGPPWRFTVAPPRRA